MGLKHRCSSGKQKMRRKRKMKKSGVNVKTPSIGWSRKRPSAFVYGEKYMLPDTIKHTSRIIYDKDEEMGVTTYTFNVSCKFCDSRCKPHICSVCIKGKYCNLKYKCTMCTDEELRRVSFLYEPIREFYNDECYPSDEYFDNMQYDVKEYNEYVTTIRYKPGGILYDKAKKEFEEMMM